MSGTIILGFAVIGSIAIWGIMPLIGFAHLLKPDSVKTTNQEYKMNPFSLTSNSKNIEEKDPSIYSSKEEDAKVLSCFSSKILGKEIFRAISKQVEAEVSDLIINFRTWDVPYIVGNENQRNERFLIDTKNIELRASGLFIVGNDKLTDEQRTSFKNIDSRMVRKSDYDNFWNDVLNCALVSSDEYWRWPTDDEAYFPSTPTKVGVSQSQDLISLKEIMTMKIKCNGSSTRSFEDFVLSYTFAIKYATVSLKKHIFTGNENVFLSTADLGDIDLTNWAICLDQKRHKLEGCPRYDENIPYDEKFNDCLDGFFGYPPQDKVVNL